MTFSKWSAVVSILTLGATHGLSTPLAARQSRVSPSADPAAGLSDPEPAARTVRLDAIVTDAQGRPILNLKASDFEIVENGVAQKIDAVEQRGAEPSPGNHDATVPIETAADELREARAPGTRVIALLLDEFHVSAGVNSDRVRNAALRFVDEQLRPSDLFVVFKPLDSVTAIRFTRDRDAARRAILGFAGRKGEYNALTEFEEKYIGRAPATVKAARAQIVFSGLRALTMRLGELEPGRSAIVLVSEGFERDPRDPRRDRDRRVPDVQGLVRAASRHNVAIYAFDPETQTSASADSTAGDTATFLQSIALQTGGEAVLRGGGLEAAFQRLARDQSCYYLLTYTSSHGGDGRFYDVQVRAKVRDARVRTRPGYWAPLRAELLRGSDSKPTAPVRALRRSPLIETWLGLTVNSDGAQQVIFTWEPAEPRGRPRAAAAVPSVVAVKVTTKTGAVLFDGELRAPRSAAGPVREQAAVFDAEPGRIQFDLSILGPDGTQIDRAAHDVDVPDANRADMLILPPQIFRSGSAKAFRQISSDPSAAPVPARAFRRTERLLLRIPVHSSTGSTVQVSARVVNRVGQVLREIAPMAGAITPGVTQFDLPLSWLAPGEYTIELNAKTATGAAREVVRIRVTG